jgi:hypothetical protein
VASNAGQAAASCSCGTTTTSAVALPQQRYTVTPSWQMPQHAIFWFTGASIEGRCKVAVIHALAPFLLCLERCCVAVLFGIYHCYATSTVQLVAILTVHALAALYTIGIIYLKSGMSHIIDAIIEALSYLCELLIITMGLVLIEHPGHLIMERVLIACYFINVALLVLPEASRVGLWILYKLTAMFRALISIDRHRVRQKQT